jgi:uncharacterized YkwD family protein
MKKNFKKVTMASSLALAMMVSVAGAASAATNNPCQPLDKETANQIMQNVNSNLQTIIKNPQFGKINIVLPQLQWKDTWNKPNTNTGTKPDTGKKPETGTKPDTGKKPETGTQPGTNTGTKPDTNTGTNTGANTSASQFAQEVVTLVNKERAKVGAKPLTMDAALSNMALDKAKDMYNNKYFDHNSPTYGSPFDMMDSYGISYRAAGENIAKGQRTPQEVMNAWMNSAGHKKNILDPNFTKIGVGYYQGVWVQEFIG